MKLMRALPICNQARGAFVRRGGTQVGQVFVSLHSGPSIGKRREVLMKPSRNGPQSHHVYNKAC